MPKKPKTLKGPTHITLGQRSRAIGITISFRLTAHGLKGVQPKSSSQEIVSKFLKKNTAGKFIKEDFPDYYRGIDKGKDESFSTATVRDVLSGVFSSRKTLINTDIKVLDQILDVISAGRMPTEESGYSLKNDRLQHPTNPQRAFFTEVKGSGSLHSKHDLARRIAVVSAMESAATSPGNDAGDILIAGHKAGLEYTLNKFTAPISASNVQPYSRLSKLKPGDKKLLIQGSHREQLKKQYRLLGGAQDRKPRGETLTASRKRAWDNTGKRMRSVSPPRDYP